MSKLFSLALNPITLVGLIALVVLVQIVQAVRVGEAGIWQARRWGLWAMCLYCLTLLLVMDIVSLAWGTSPAQLAESSIQRGLMSAFLGYVGLGLIVLTVTGGIIAGIGRLVSRRR